jgi:hypothetical protein
MFADSINPWYSIQLQAPEQNVHGFERSGNSPGSTKPGWNLHVLPGVLNNMFNENAGVLSVDNHTV